MNTQRINLDLAKRTGNQMITLAQGDKSGTTIVATIYDNGTKLAETGVTAAFLIQLPDREHYVRDSATYSGGVVTYVCDESKVAAVDGYTDNAYFELKKGSTIVSTERFSVAVLPCAYDGMEPGESYDSAIQEAIDDLNDAIEAIPDTVEDVLEAHPEWTTTVQNGAVTDAKLYQGAGGILARNARLMYRLDNLLSAQLPEGDSATATDAAKTPLAGLSLYGRSTQDGTPTPSAPVAIESVGGNLLPNNGSSQTLSGITFTVNADGSVTCSGTNTSSGPVHFNIVNGRGTEKLRLPDGTYTLWAWQDGTGVSNTYLSLMKESVYVAQDVLRVVGSNGCSVAAIEGYDYDAIHVGFFIAAGATVSATIRFALFAGDQSMGAGYVPYGCAGLWARGKNLLNPAQAFGGVSYYTVNADGSVTVTAEDSRGWASVLLASLDAGTYTLSISGNTGGRVSLHTVSGSTETALSGFAGDGSATFTLASAGGIRVKVHQGTFPRTVRIQVEAGSTATAYQPYAETVTPIDLDGHELRSLPDGTRDELTVGADGRVTLLQRVGSVDLGTLTWSYDSNGYFYSDSLTDKAFGNYNILSDAYAVTSATSATGMSSGEIKGHASAVRLFAKNSAYTTAEAFKTAVSGVTLLYALAAPQTIDLGWTDAIPLCGPDLTAQAVPSAPFALTYERDLNVTLARLEAALAALA